MPANRPPEVDEVAWGPIIRTGWWLILLGLACGTVVGAWLAQSTGERLRVTVEVLVKPLTRDPLAVTARPIERLSMDNEARLAVSDIVLRRAQALLPDRPPLDELREVIVQAIPGSTVMQISFVTREEKVSRERAEAVATSYLAQRTDDARLTNEAMKAEVRKQLETATTDLRRGDGDERVLVGRVNELQARLDELDRFVADPGTTFRGPSDAEHAGPSGGLIALGVALVGMLLGVAGATLRLRLRRDNPGPGAVVHPR